MRYVAISTKTDAKPPFAAVDLVYGPTEKISKRELRQWWHLEVRTNVDQVIPSCIVRALTDGDPLTLKRPQLHFARYQLQIPETGETLEYVDKHSGQPLLPPWLDFQKYFVPQPAEVAHLQKGAPETCEYLGHVVSLQSVGREEGWTNWANVKRLELDREVLVGTGRNFKDAEGKRLPQAPQKTEYTYVPFKQEDYPVMFEAGMNLFMVDGTQQQWVRDEAVFYVLTATPRFPTDFYRANYFGMAMFMDEPASILTWDQFAQGKVKYFSDAVTLIEKRARVSYDTQPYGRYWLESQLAGGGFNFGDMRLAQTECPVWETFFDRSYYALKGGGSGIVHEGRYNLNTFNWVMNQTDAKKRQFTSKQMLQYYYSFLRGGARSFDKPWGTAIYGQCDTNVAPQAFTQAYDMGARYFWFWTSDHDHHMPWPEQLDLSRKLKAHAREHPRNSIYAAPPKLGAVILIPKGYFVSFDWIGWLHVLDNKEGDEATKYSRLLQRTYDEIHNCLKRGEDFDITIDDGRAIKGYKRVVRLSAE
ncbi:MAG: hypothetical protein JWM68_4852 [Verrucomicrobiales bacterium]|nr:hypothetical protein [Verrucomicrobiales bacterium]